MYTVLSEGILKNFLQTMLEQSGLNLRVVWLHRNIDKNISIYSNAGPDKLLCLILSLKTYTMQMANIHPSAKVVVVTSNIRQVPNVKNVFATSKKELCETISMIINEGQKEPLKTLDQPKVFKKEMKMEFDDNDDDDFFKMDSMEVVPNNRKFSEKKKQILFKDFIRAHEVLKIRCTRKRSNSITVMQFHQKSSRDQSIERIPIPKPKNISFDVFFDDEPHVERSPKIVKNKKKERMKARKEEEEGSQVIQTQVILPDFSMEGDAFGDVSFDIFNNPPKGRQRDVMKDVSFDVFNNYRNKSPSPPKKGRRDANGREEKLPAIKKHRVRSVSNLRKQPIKQSVGRKRISFQEFLTEFDMIQVLTTQKIVQKRKSIHYSRFYSTISKNKPMESSDPILNEDSLLSFNDDDENDNSPTSSSSTTIDSTSSILIEVPLSDNENENENENEHNVTLLGDIIGDEEIDNEKDLIMETKESDSFGDDEDWNFDIDEKKSAVKEEKIKETVVEKKKKVVELSFGDEDDDENWDLPDVNSSDQKDVEDNEMVQDSDSVGLESFFETPGAVASQPIPNESSNTQKQPNNSEAVEKNQIQNEESLFDILDDNKQEGPGGKNSNLGSFFNDGSAHAPSSVIVKDLDDNAFESFFESFPKHKNNEQKGDVESEIMESKLPVDRNVKKIEIPVNIIDEDEKSVDSGSKTPFDSFFEEDLNENIPLDKSNEDQPMVPMVPIFGDKDPIEEKIIPKETPKKETNPSGVSPKKKMLKKALPPPPKINRLKYQGKTNVASSSSVARSLLGEPDQDDDFIMQEMTVESEVIIEERKKQKKKVVEKKRKSTNIIPDRIISVEKGPVDQLKSKKSMGFMRSSAPAVVMKTLERKKPIKNSVQKDPIIPSTPSTPKKTQQKQRGGLDQFFSPIQEEKKTASEESLVDFFSSNSDVMTTPVKKIASPKVKVKDSAPPEKKVKVLITTERVGSFFDLDLSEKKEKVSVGEIIKIDEDGSFFDEKKIIQDGTLLHGFSTGDVKEKEQVVNQNPLETFFEGPKLDSFFDVKSTPQVQMQVQGSQPPNPSSFLDFSQPQVIDMQKKPEQQQQQPEMDLLFNQNDQSDDPKTKEGFDFMDTFDSMTSDGSRENNGNTNTNGLNNGNVNQIEANRGKTMETKKDTFPKDLGDFF